MLRILALTAALGLAALSLNVPPSFASRFGPPWQAVVVVDQTAVRDHPDASAAVVGSLPRGSIVAVTGVQDDWTMTTLGAVPSGDIAESIEPWVADVVASSASVYAKPNARDAIRLTVKKGDLVRVTGVSPGQAGDTNLWWATTRGTSPWTPWRRVKTRGRRNGRCPTDCSPPNGWWARATSSIHVRAGPSTEAPVVGQMPAGQLLKVLVSGPGEEVDGDPTWDRIDGGRYAGGWVHASLVRKLDQQPVANTSEPSGGSEAGRWIVVDRSKHSLTLVDHGNAVFSTFVALGTAGRETPQRHLQHLG